MLQQVKMSGLMDAVNKSLDDALARGGEYERARIAAYLRKLNEPHLAHDIEQGEHLK